MVKPDFVVTFIDATEAILKYTVQDFSKMYGPNISPPCYVLNIPWKIMILPRAFSDDRLRWSKRYLSYFLQCNNESKSKNWNCYAFAELSILPVRSDIQPLKKVFRHIFNSKKNKYGFDFYSFWDDILNPKNGYIENDNVTFQLHLITEAPKSLGIIYDWKDLSGRICVPKEKWSNITQSLYNKKVEAIENKNEPNKDEEVLKIENYFKGKESETLSEVEEIIQWDYRDNIRQWK